MAFDTMDHGILLQELELCGLQVISVKWFDNYLSNHLQYVTYDNVKSDKENVKCGVPQGSILGTSLCLLYMNDPMFRLCLPFGVQTQIRDMIIKT